MSEELIYEHDVEPILKSILQNTLAFEFNRRQTKKGKFVLYKIHHHAIVFMLEDKGLEVTHRVPYPFAVDLDEPQGIVKFNYALSALFGQGSPLIGPAAEYAQSYRPSRYYNNTLTIRIK